MNKPQFQLWEFLKSLGLKEGEWQLVAKGHWRILQRPGFDLRVRVYATCQLHAMGFPGGGGEFCIKQVPVKGRRPAGDPLPPKFVAFTPTDISVELFNVGVEEHRSSDHELTAAERKRLRISPQHIRRIMESLDTADGAITSVTVAKFLARDEATRKAGWQDLETLIHEGLTYKEALARKLVAPIRELANSDRKRLACKSFIYCHAIPRPATVAALMRRADEDFSLSKTAKEIHVELTAGAQRVFQFMRTLGVDDPRLADQLSKIPLVVEGIEHLVTAEVTLASARQLVRERQLELRGRLEPIVDAVKRGLPIDLPPAIEVQGELPLYGPPALVAKVSADANPNRQETVGPPLLTPQSAASAESTAPDDIDIVVRKGQDLGLAIDDDWASMMLDRCREQTPDATGAEIAHMVEQKWHQLKNKRNLQNMPGLLMWGVPKLCKGQSFQAYRLRQREAAEQERAQKAQAAAQHAEYAREILATPTDKLDAQGRPFFDDAERQWARDILAQSEVA